jgi:diguanylate cyclase (GGDEF)-like protein
MSLSRRFTETLLGFGRGWAEAAIIGVSVGGSLLLTFLSLGVLADAGSSWEVPIAIATIVPLAVSTPVAIGLMSLLRQLEAARRKAHDLASTDQLTGLFNRRSWIERAEREVRAARSAGHPAVLLMLDVDSFKQVNDAYGHAAGDEVLRAVAAAARSALRPGDVLARWGGEEFVLLLPGTVEADGLRIAERVRASVAAAEVTSQGRPVPFTASLGVVALTRDLGGNALEELLHLADCALYAAKESGRNCVRLAPGRAMTTVKAG